LYTAARVDLHLSAREFWRLKPRKLMAMIKEQRKSSRYNMQILAYLARGGTLEELDEETEGWDKPANTSWLTGNDTKGSGSIMIK